MTLDEAIADLSIQLEEKHRLGKEYQATAIELGIEAIRRIKDARTYEVEVEKGLLPSETKE